MSATTVEEMENKFSDDEEVIPEVHNKLLSAISTLYKKKKIEAPKRTEPAAEVSEFNLSSANSDSNVVKVNALISVLNQRATHKEISFNVKRAQRKSKTLKKPLEKIQADRIARSLGYKTVKTQLNKWDAVVTRNRAAGQLEFPLKSNKVEQILNIDAPFKARTELEKELEALYNSSETCKEEKKMEEKLISLNLPLKELIERRKMIGKMRARESYRIAKAVRQNKIKSKKYHRILKREKIKKELRDFEILQKTNPEAALEKLEQIERARAEERISLRHKNTGKWARSRAIRAKYDTEARAQLAEQLGKSRELTKKLKSGMNSSEEGEEEEEEPVVITELAKEGKNQEESNPWFKSLDPNNPVIPKPLLQFVDLPAKQIGKEQSETENSKSEEKFVKETDTNLIKEQNNRAHVETEAGETTKEIELTVEENEVESVEVANNKIMENSLNDQKTDLVKGVEKCSTENLKNITLSEDLSGVKEDVNIELKGEMKNNSETGNQNEIKKSKKKRKRKTRSETKQEIIVKSVDKNNKITDSLLNGKEIKLDLDNKINEKCPENASCAMEDVSLELKSETKINSEVGNKNEIKKSKKKRKRKTRSETKQESIVKSVEKNNKTTDSLLNGKETKLELDNKINEKCSENASYAKEDINTELKSETKEDSEMGNKNEIKKSKKKPKRTKQENVVQSVEKNNKITDSLLNGKATKLDLDNETNEKYSTEKNMSSEELLSTKRDVNLELKSEIKNNIEIGNIREIKMDSRNRKRKLIEETENIIENKPEKKEEIIKCSKWTIEDIFEGVENEIKDAVTKKLDKMKKKLLPVKKKTKIDNKKEKRLDLAMKSERTQVILDEHLIEVADGCGISTGENSVKEILDKFDSPKEPENRIPDIDPNKFMHVKQAKLLTEIPVLEEEGDATSGPDEEKERHMNIVEAFADDDVVDEFRQEKQDEIDSSKPKEIDLSLPGWGHWAGTGINPSQGRKRKNRRFIIKFPEAPRKDDKKERVIIHEDVGPKLKQHMVNDLPYPFKSVQDYEASIRVPIGDTWVPQMAHKRLIEPPIVTKLGSIIEPMDHSELVKKNKVNQKGK